MDLLNELNVKVNELNTSVKQLRLSGQKYAEAYTKYRIELAKELLKLKNEGMPVTIAYDIARGKESIAKEKYNEICQEAIYKANQEAINSTKLQIKILENQIDREWSATGK